MKIRTQVIALGLTGVVMSALVGAVALIVVSAGKGGAGQGVIEVAGALAISCAVMVAAALWLAGRMTGPMNYAVEVAEQLAGGDLATQIVPSGSGETVLILQALEAMRSSFAGIVRNVKSNADQVAVASSEIAQGNQDLSDRTEQQSSSLQQTASTMDHLGENVRNNADNARQANQLAMGATSVAVKGGETMNQVVETMNGINDSSRKISDIISVIDGIAFQTNILALNAAVEAARAGEQGRGFAVVASEVRSLAQRSAEAAKEIKLLINASVERVEQGTSLVGQAGQQMNEIVVSIKRVTDIVAEISSASIEQSAGVSAVGQAVTNMDQTTQQNAALVEQSAAAAASLSQQANDLVRSVAAFKLAAADGRASTSSSPATYKPTITKAAKPMPAMVDRRGPNRATNVTRPKFAAKASSEAAVFATAPVVALAAAPLAKEPLLVPASSTDYVSAKGGTGTDDNWESF